MNGSCPVSETVREVSAGGRMERSRTRCNGDLGGACRSTAADAGLAVTIFEAEDRIGGCIFTLLYSEHQAQHRQNQQPGKLPFRLK